MHDNLEIEEETPAMKYAPTVSVTRKGRVKLKLMGTCFEETCAVMGNYSVKLGQLVDADPWLEAHTAGKRATLALLIDLWEEQVAPHVLRSQPEVVTLNLSRCEAHVLWKLVMDEQPRREVYPAFTALITDLHKALS